MVLDHVHAITTALRSRSKYCILGDGEEVKIDQSEIVMTLPGQLVKFTTRLVVSQFSCGFDGSCD